MLEDIPSAWRKTTSVAQLLFTAYASQSSPHSLERLTMIIKNFGSSICSFNYFFHQCFCLVLLSAVEADF